MLLDNESNFVTHDIPQKEGSSKTFPASRYIMQSLLQNLPPRSRVCEIGFLTGTSAERALRAGHDVVSFDLGGENALMGYSALKAKYGDDRIQVLWGDSTETVPQAPPLNCDVFLVDGGHDVETAKADLFNIQKHVNPSTLVVMDDVYCQQSWCQGPTKAWKEALTQNRFTEHFHVVNDESKGQGIAFGTPSVF